MSWRKALRVQRADHSTLPFEVGQDRWIQDGHEMASREGVGVFGSIDAKHGAEKSAGEVLAQQLKAQGRIALERRNEIADSLQRNGFEPGRHLKELAQGRIDLAWAAGLSVLNAALIVFVLLAFGPSWLAMLLALSVLASTLSVEEFFNAYDEKEVFREGIFLTLAGLALAAQFWLGSLRGMFLTALAPETVGPVTETLHRAGPILQYSLGLLALVTECLAGYKWYRVRVQLYSATASAVSERDRLNDTLITLHAGVRATECEAEMRRAYRQIGARQFLASRLPAKMPPERHHLARALRGALIALAVVFGLLLFSSYAFAEVLQTTVVLLDLTKSTSKDSFQANVAGVSNVLSQLPAGERVMVNGITDDFSHPLTLLDRTLPSSSGYLGLALKAAREGLVAEWRKIAAALEPTYPRTDVIGSLILLTHFGDLSFKRARLIVFSDLRQSKRLNLESMDEIPAKKIVAGLRRAKSIPQLNGASVALLGVDPSGKSPSYFRSLKEFWLLFFAEAGASVSLFSVGRGVSEF